MDRRKEVIEICLNHFIANGLEVSTRSLSNALQLQNAGLYYYFSSKDELILACAEEAALRLERALILPALAEFGDLNRMIANLKVRADEMTPMMRFFVTVCSNQRYTESVKPVLDRMNERYDHYAQMLAEMLNSEKECVEPYMWMFITSVSNYMIFANDHFVTPQVETAYKGFSKLIQNLTEEGSMSCE